METKQNKIDIDILKDIPKNNELPKASTKLQENVKNTIIFPNAVREFFCFPYRFRIVLLINDFPVSLFRARDNKI